MSCCFPLSSHIIPAGTWIEARQIPVTSMRLSISSSARIKASKVSVISEAFPFKIAALAPRQLESHRIHYLVPYC